MERLCAHCKKDISDRSKQAKYCSRACNFAEYSGTQVSISPTVCETCKIEFMPKTRKKTRFCSYNCLYKSILAKGKKVLEPRACDQCGKEFQPNRAFQKYCSSTCRIQLVNMVNRMGLSTRDFQIPVGAMTLPEPKAVETPLPAVTEIPEGMTLALCNKCGTKHVESEIDEYCPSCVAEMRKEVEAQAIKQSGWMQ